MTGELSVLGCAHVVDDGAEATDTLFIGTVAIPVCTECSVCLQGEGVSHSVPVVLVNRGTLL